MGRRKYYQKNPSEKVIYIYTGTFKKASNRPLIRPAKTPLYYQVKMGFESWADNGDLRQFSFKIETSD